MHVSSAADPCISCYNRKKKFMAVVVDTSNDVQHSRAVMAD